MSNLYLVSGFVLLCQPIVALLRLGFLVPFLSVIVFFLLSTLSSFALVNLGLIWINLFGFLVIHFRGLSLLRGLLTFSFPR